MNADACGTPGVWKERHREGNSPAEGWCWCCASDDAARVRTAERLFGKYRGVWGVVCPGVCGPAAGAYVLGPNLSPGALAGPKPQTPGPGRGQTSGLKPQWGGLILITALSSGWKSDGVQQQHCLAVGACLLFLRHEPGPFGKRHRGGPLVEAPPLSWAFWRPLGWLLNLLLLLASSSLCCGLRGDSGWPWPCQCHQRPEHQLAALCVVWRLWVNQFCRHIRGAHSLWICAFWRAGWLVVWKRAALTSSVSAVRPRLMSSGTHGPASRQAGSPLPIPTVAVPRAP